MTNEELALMIKSGDKNAEIILWENIAALVKKNARYFCYKYSCYNLTGSYEDMLQEAFISMISAANHYKTVDEGGKTFWGYFKSYYLAEAFDTAAWGGHTKKKLGEPLNHAFSLDCSLNDSGILPIDNIIEDVHVASRPLLQEGPQKLYDLDKQRHQLYLDACDYHLINDSSLENIVNNIISIITFKYN